MTENKVKRREYKFNDLSGTRYDQLLVLHRTDDYVSKKSIQVQFTCVCDCGREIVVRATTLRRGKKTSCGCTTNRAQKQGLHPNLQDLTGQKFNRWTVMYRAESLVEPSGRKATMWHCQCDCGFEDNIRSGTLKSGLSKSCGCLKTDVLGIERDLVGQTFGRWTVLERADDQIKFKTEKMPKGRRVKYWLCKCECGSEKLVTEQSLVRGKSVSCGCYRKEQRKKNAVYVDLSGNTYGLWTVLERVPDRFYQGGGRATMWKCRCSCGNENIVAGNMLKAGISQSCGCVIESKAERHITRYLTEKGYGFKAQKTYDDLRGLGNGFLSYDFLVYNDTTKSETLCLIEYQGEQHFRPVVYFGGDAKFEIQQQHDELKRTYATSKQIPLFEIMYTSYTYEAISSVLDEHFRSII